MIQVNHIAKCDCGSMFVVSQVTKDQPVNIFCTSCGSTIIIDVSAVNGLIEKQEKENE